MAHQLEILANGQGSMFSVGKKPWHELGTVLDSPPTVVEGIQASGLNWYIHQEALITRDTLQMTNRVANVRSRDGAILGVVGQNYQPLQNIDAFKWFQPFLDEGIASLESAGSLFDGRKIWVLAKLNSQNATIVEGDEIEKYILLSNSHDGTQAVRLGFTPVRVVCNNTLNYAHETGGSKLIRAYHTASLMDTIETIREVMNTAEQRFEATFNEYRKLAQKNINTDDLRKYIRMVFQPKQEVESDTEPGRVETAVIKLFESGMGSDIPGVKGTVWGAYNAVVEYMQYHRGKDPNQRFNNVWFNGAKPLEAALKLAA